MNTSFRLSLAFLLATAAAPVRAATTQLTAPAQFVGPITTITFDDVAAGSPYTGYAANTRYTSLGVTFAGDTPGNIAIYTPGYGEFSSPNVMAGVGGPNETFTSVVNLTFANPVTELGAFFGNDQNASVFNTMGLNIYDSGHNLLDSISVVANNNFYADQFIGLRSTVPFYFARFENLPQPNGGLSVFLDNVSFTTIAVPEPAALSCAAVGALVLLSRKGIKPRSNGQNPV